MSVPAINQPAYRLVFDTVLDSAAGGLAAMSSKMPIGATGGAVFGACRYLSDCVIEPFFRSLLVGDDPVVKIVRTAVPLILSFGAAAYLTALSGFPMAMSEVTVLAFQSILASVALKHILNRLQVPYGYPLASPSVR